MKVSALIDLLKTFPPDAEVVQPHAWEWDNQQLDPIDLDAVELVNVPGTSPVVVIR